MHHTTRSALSGEDAKQLDVTEGTLRATITNNTTKNATVKRSDT